MLSDIIQLSLYALGCIVSHFWGRSIGYRNGGQDTMDFHYEEGYNRGANDATNAIKGPQNKENL